MVVIYTKFKCNNHRYYEIRQEKENFFAIYVGNYGEPEFLTHRQTLNQAQKLCKLLRDAYCDGFNEAKDIYSEY